MIRVTKELAEAVSTAIQAAQKAGDLPEFDFDTPPVTPAKPEHGDYATPVAMPLARVAKMAPPKIAEAIVKHFDKPVFIGDVSLAGGFINFSISEGWLQQQVDAILEAAKPLAQMDDFAGKRVQVECVSANPTGPISIGRIRGGVIGDTLGRMMAAMGYEVEREYYFNNAGAQMRHLGESLRARYLQKLDKQAEEDFPEDGYHGEYMYDIAAQLVKEVGADWVDRDDLQPFMDYAEKVIGQGQRDSLARIRIVFDNYFNERTLYDSNAVWDVLERLEKAGLTYKAVKPKIAEDADLRPDNEDIEAAAEGEAIWIKMMQLRGTSKDKVLVKASGEPAYRMPDIAYHINKLERGFDLAINLLGADHLEEAEDVKAAVAALGYDAERIQYIIHQFVSVKRSGEKVRQSTRRGEYIAIDELVNKDQVGADAIRYFVLEIKPDRELVFDVDRAKKMTNENPVFYIENAHVRCASILREAADRDIEFADGDVALLKDASELALIKALVGLPDALERAVTELRPHLFAHWTHEELAATFHPVYEEVRAMHGDVSPELTKARLKLYAAAKKVIARSLSLMGMSIPERM